jgi:type II secretory pathway pseudopilin PulG
MLNMSFRSGAPMPARTDERGFTILELVISVAILMVISGLMLQGVVDMTRANQDQSNRSEMHAGIRNATALLQQEVGQAGRLTFPADVSLATAVTGGTASTWVTVTPNTTNMFVDMWLVVGQGPAEEIVRVQGVNTGSNQIQAVFTNSHDSGARVAPSGGFGAGIVPTTMANGSTASVLKIVGDVNGDGNVVYVEYTCDWVGGRMFRNMMPVTAVSKPAVTVEQILLDNLLPNPPNPNGTVPPCFSYQEQTISGTTYVINVAIMTTVRTQDRHPITGEFMVVTKALLNVAPRNVFHTWQSASFGYSNRIQPLPATVVSLLE